MTRRDLKPAVLFISFAAIPKHDDAIDLQRKIGQQRADELGLQIVHEIEELGASAMRFKNRVAFQALLNYFDDHPEVRYVIFPSMGRISKSVANLVTIMKEFEGRNVSIVTFDGRIATSSDIQASLRMGMRALTDSMSADAGGGANG
ncbi:recombinase family protein [Nocardia brasiliensis]|uniref:recombinase family protein n=1 Tax=Nocardia brasiliensis TaxID=37326 RepID=UPI003D8E0709